jgi:hypothetical protein
MITEALQPLQQMFNESKRQKQISPYHNILPPVGEK